MKLSQNYSVSVSLSEGYTMRKGRPGDWECVEYQIVWTNKKQAHDVVLRR